ncbi:AraC family transcriptional regulator [Clostridium swellfunianum]|uniref:helix-turn-helix domain-containing protein n=1 Tax=Clostridium swellfunianum TaxID=1367462 RepID=UPI00202E1A93|nr:helix-turn-helix domain-containing protein [Clostridium swellfunianum]MCM0649579.1 AraC family transcriptional regulator [Clostridium swellfunianum]
MKMIKISNKNTLQRLIIFNLILVVVMTIIPQIFYFRYLNVFIESHVKESNMQSIKNMQNSIDENIITDIISFPNKYLSNLPSNEDLTYPLDNNISSDTSRTINIYRSINDIKGKNSLIHSIDLFYPKSNMLFYDGNVIFLDKAIERGSALPDWIDTKNYVENQFKWVVHNDSTNKVQILSFIRTIPLFAENNNIKGIVSINVETDTISKEMQKHQSPEDGIALIVDSYNNIISSNQTSLNNEIVREIKESYISPQNQNLDKYTGIMYLDKKKYMVSSVVSDVNNWTYISLIPISEYYDKTNSVRNIILIAGVIMLAINISMAYILARKAHKPIADEIHELTEKIEKNQPIIKQHFFTNLLKGNIREKFHVSEQGKLFNFTLDSNQFSVFNIYIHEEAYKSFEDLVLLPHKIIESIEAKEAPSKLWFVQGESTHIYGIVELNNDISLNQIIDYLHCKLKMNIGNFYTIGVGNACNGSIDSISQSFKEAEVAAEYYFIYPNVNTISYSELDFEAMKESESSVRILNKIQSYLQAGDKKSLQEAIASIIEGMANGFYRIENCRNILLDIVTTIKKSINNLGYSTKEMFGYSIRERYKKINNINEFKEWINSIIDISTEKINEKKSSSDYNLDEKIIKYISDHIYDNLSLEILADYIGVTPNYLSKIFKQRFGLTFSEYLIDIKLNNAIILLKEKDITVQDIAYKLGYNSAHYFIKVFKQKYGITPKQYQKQNF